MAFDGWTDPSQLAIGSRQSPLGPMALDTYREERRPRPPRSPGLAVVCWPADESTGTTASALPAIGLENSEEHPRLSPLAGHALASANGSVA